MSVIISFVTPKGIGSIHAPGIGTVRVREDESLDGTTTATVAEGEVVIVANNETSMIAVAFGTTPDADATAATAATSAGVAIPAGQSLALVPAEGDKINVKAL